MAKRFFASEIWEEDWFLDMPNEYRWFWFYMLAKCDHAGVFRVNPRSIRGKIEAEVTPSRALSLINVDKQRIRVLKDGVWLIEDFFVFQYGPKFNINNKVHESIAKVYARHDVDIKTIRGLTEVNLTPKTPQRDPKHGAKDKDKEKDYREEVGGIEVDKGGMGGQEGEKGEEVGGNPNMLVPQMHSVWKDAFPLYTSNVELDYPALRSIAGFIFKTAGIRNGFGNVDAEIKTLNTFQLIADQVNREPFWVNKPLVAISKNIQEFYNKLKNPQDGAGKNGKQKVSGVDEDTLKRKLAEKDPNRRQDGN